MTVRRVRPTRWNLEPGFYYGTCTIQLRTGRPRTVPTAALPGAGYGSHDFKPWDQHFSSGSASTPFLFCSRRSMRAFQGGMAFLVGTPLGGTRRTDINERLAQIRNGQLVNGSLGWLLPAFRGKKKHGKEAGASG